MPDVTIVSGGLVARTCDALLGRAGFDVHRAIEVDADARCPVILGETQSAFAVAKQILNAGRHLLVASPASMTAGQLTALLDANVLYPAPVRDILMQVALEVVFRTKWTADTHREWIEALFSFHLTCLKNPVKPVKPVKPIRSKGFFLGRLT